MIEKTLAAPVNWQKKADRGRYFKFGSKMITCRHILNTAHHRWLNAFFQTASKSIRISRYLGKRIIIAQFGCSFSRLGWRVMVVGMPKIEVAQNLFDHRRLVDKGDNMHIAQAFGANQGIDFINSVTAPARSSQRPREPIKSICCFWKGVRFRPTPE